MGVTTELRYRISLADDTFGHAICQWAMEHFTQGNMDDSWTSMAQSIQKKVRFKKQVNLYHYEATFLLNALNACLTEDTFLRTIQLQIIDNIAKKVGVPQEAH